MPMTDVELRALNMLVDGWDRSPPWFDTEIVPFLFDMPGGSLWTLAGKLLRCSELRCAEMVSAYAAAASEFDEAHEERPDPQPFWAAQQQDYPFCG